MKPIDGNIIAHATKTWLLFRLLPKSFTVRRCPSPNARSALILIGVQGFRVKM